MIRTRSVRPTLLLSTSLAAGMLAATPALAQPAPGTVPTGVSVGAQDAGGTTITTGLSGNTLNVNLGNNRRSILNWTSFDLASDSAVAFNSTVPLAERAFVLNRDLSGTMSEIYGTITGPSNLNVFILNPNGVLFGGSAVVNVGGLVAGTLGLADADFMNGGSFNFTGAGTNAVSVLSGAQITTASGPLVLVAGTVSNAGTLTGAGDVALVTASDVTMTIDPGSPLSMTIAQGSAVNGGIVAGGTINGRNVYMAAVSRVGVTDALLNVTGVVTATGAAVTDRGIVLTAGASGAGITVDGSGDVTGDADVDVAGSLASDKDVELRSANAIGGAGTISADEDVAASAGAALSIGRIEAGGNIDLGAGTAVGNALQDIDLNAGGTISVSGPLQGRDVAMNAGGNISVVGTVSARDDIVIRSATAVATGNLTSGATVAGQGATNANGAADTLAGANLIGHDIDVVANNLLTGSVRAIATANSDVRLDGGVSGIGDATANLDIAAGGSITLTGPARGIDVALEAGDDITTGEIRARDDIAIAADTGAVQTGTLVSGATIGILGAIDVNDVADTLAGVTLTGQDVDIVAERIVVGPVAALGASSDVGLTITFSGTSIGDGSSDLSINAGGNILLAGNAQGRDIALVSGGQTTAGGLRARDDIVVNAGTAAFLGAVETGVTVSALAATDVAGAADTAAAATLTGNEARLAAGGTLTLGAVGTFNGNVSLTGDDITGAGLFGSTYDFDLTITDTAGDLAIGTALDVGGNLSLDATAGNLLLTSNLTAGGDMSLSALGNVSLNTLALNADNVDVGGNSLISGLVTVSADEVSFAGTINAPIAGPNRLQITAPGGTTFGGAVGGTVPLERLTVTGPVTLNTGTLVTTDGITLGATSLTQNTAIDAGGGVLTVGPITASVAGLTLSLDAGAGANSILAGNIGTSGTRLGNVSFLAPTRLSGNIFSNAAVSFASPLVVSGARSITADSAVFAALDGAAAGTNSLSVDTVTGTTFNGAVGASQRLASLSVTGPSLLNATLVQTDNGLTLGAVTLTGSTLLDAGNGILTVNGPITTNVVGANLTLDAGPDTQGGNELRTILVGNIGTDSSRLGNVTFIRSTQLSGDIYSNATVSFDGDLVLAGGADRTIVANTAVFGTNNQDDIWSATGNEGLAVLVNTTATFRGDIGTDDDPLRAFGISANSVDTGFLLGNKINAGTLAASVQTGDFSLSTNNDLAIGSVGIISGLNAANGSVTVTTSNGADLAINGSVTAFNGVTLSAAGNLTGSAQIVAGNGNVASAADVTLTAGGSLSVGTVSATDDIVIDAGGLVTTGALTAGAGAVVLDNDASGDLVGGAVSITGNGVRPGAITVTSNIILDGGAGGVGTAATNLTLLAPGNISITGTARGLDIDLRSTGGAISTDDLAAAANLSVLADLGISIGNATAIDIAMDSSGNIDTGSLQARDDIAVRSFGLLSTGAVTSGATIGGNGPIEFAGVADALLGGVLDFSAHDIAMGGFNGVVSGPVRALGAGSDVLLATGGAAIGNGLTSIDIAAGGSIQLQAAARGIDIALSAGTSVTTGDLSARDDVVVRSGTSSSLGIVLAGTTVDALAPVDLAGAADTLAGRTLDNADADLSAGTTLSYAAGTTIGDDLTLVAQEITGALGGAGGDLSITDTLGGLTISSLTANGSLSIETQNGDLTVSDLTSTTGDISLTVSGTGTALTLAGNVTTSTGVGRTVSLTSPGTIAQTGGIVTTNRLTGSAGGAVTLNQLNAIARLGSFTASGMSLRTVGGLTVDGAVDGGSSLTLDAGGPLALNAAVETGGLLTLRSGGAITQTTAFTAGSLTGSSTGATSLTNAGNSVATLAGFTANGFNLDTAGDLTVSAALAGGAGGVGIDSGGALTVNAIVSTTGPVTLTANGDVGVSGGITGGGIDIAANGTGSVINLAAPVNAGSGTLSLLADGGIAQTAAGALTAGTLNVDSASGLVRLDLAANAIGSLGTIDSQGFLLRTSGGLTVNGTVDGGNSAEGVAITTNGPLTVVGAILTQDDDIRLDAGTGTLSIQSALDAGSATLDLRGGSIVQTAAGVITAGILTGAASGSALLNTASNDIATLGNFTASQFALRNAGALTISGNIITSGAASPGIAIEAAGISHAAGSLLDAGSQTIRLDGNGGAVILAGELRTTSAAADAIAIVDTAAVQLGNVRASSGTLVLGQAGATVGGAVTQAGGTTIEVAGLTVAAPGAAVTLGNAGNSVGSLGRVEAASLVLRDDVGGLGIAADQRIAGTLDLQVANGAVTQSGGTVEANLLTGSSNGGASFALAGNAIQSLGPWTNSGAGGFNLSTGGALAIAGDVAAGTGTLTLQAASISGAGRRLSSGGAATITASTGGISLGEVDAGTAAVQLTAATALDATTARGGSITGSGTSVDIGTAQASSGALALTASSGRLRLGTGTAGTTATLNKQGATDELEITTSLGAQGNVTVSSATSARIAEITSATGNIAVTAAGEVTGVGGSAGARLVAGTGATSVTVVAPTLARLGEVTAATVQVDAANLDIETSRLVTGRTSITLNNTGSATNVTRLGDNAGSGGFTLSATEMGQLRSPTLTIQSGARSVAIGSLPLNADTGSTRLNILTSGRIDVTGSFRQATPLARTVQLGGTAQGAGQASVLRVAATDSAGGRLLFEGGTLELRAAKIGVGQDAGFLDAVGVGLTDGATPLSQPDVSRRFVGNANSTLYRAQAVYTDPILVLAGSLRLHYADYALFQNTAIPGGRPSGVELAGTIRPMLQLNSSGVGGANAFAMFAVIDGRRGLEAAILPRDILELNNVNLGNTRINGCLAGSGSGGCIVNTVAQPLVNVFDAGRAEVLSAGGELPISFDPIVGANNEALFAGLSSIEDIVPEEECKPDEGRTCPAPERNN